MIKDIKKIHKLISGFMITVSLAFSAYTSAAYAYIGYEDDSVYIQPVAEESFVSEGKNTVLISGNWEQFTVNLKVKGIKEFAEGNDGFGANNYTFFVTYDPDVVRMTGITYPGESDIAANYVNYEKDGKKVAMYEGNDISSCMYAAPAADNIEYAAVNPDGKKTSVELGMIKMAYCISTKDSNNILCTANDDGILVGLNFRAVGEGDTKLAVCINSYADGFHSTPSAKKEMKTVALESNIYVKDISQGGMMGDLDYDGLVTAEDAEILLKHLAGVQVLSWKQLNYADVTGSGVDMRDVIEILKMAE